ncbi:hypothetical protein [Prosthecobacter fusiformis]|nr:hypothetical protein [Prosthecobacter fusiformis]
MKRLIVIFSFVAFTAIAAEPAVLLESLRNEIIAVIKTARESKNQTDRVKALQAETLLSSFSFDDLLSEREYIIISRIEKIRAVPLSEKIDGMCIELIAEIKARTARKNEEWLANYDSTLLASLQDAFTATTARELDASISTLEKMQKDIVKKRSTEDLPSGYNQEALQTLVLLLTSIQDIMLEKENPLVKRQGEFADRFQYSTINTYSKSLNSIIPRSEFIEKLNRQLIRISPESRSKPLTTIEFEEHVKPWILAIKSLDDLSEVTKKAEDLSKQQQDGNFSGNYPLATQLRNYQMVYENFKRGSVITSRFNYSEYNSASSETLFAVKDMLTRYAIARLLNVPESPSNKDNESVSTFLQRVLKEAIATEDWPLLARLLEILQTMQIHTAISSSDQAVFKQFLGAINLEKAQQHADAVAVYITVLRSGSQLIPTTKIAESLAAIKRDYPEEYKAGLSSAYSYSPRREAGIYSDISPILQQQSGSKSSASPLLTDKSASKTSPKTEISKGEAEAKPVTKELSPKDLEKKPAGPAKK